MGPDTLGLTSVPKGETQTDTPGEDTQKLPRAGEDGSDAPTRQGVPEAARSRSEPGTRPPCAPEGAGLGQLGFGVPGPQNRERVNPCPLFHCSGIRRERRLCAFRPFYLNFRSF